MPPQPHRPAELEWRIFLGSEAVRSGLLTEHQLRGQAWRRISHNVYADARLEYNHALICRAMILRLPKGVDICGPSAAVLHGVEFAAGLGDPVHVTAPPGVRVSTQRGVVVHATDLPDEWLDPESDVPCATAAVTAWQVAAWLAPEKAVGSLDAMLRRGLVTPAELEEQIAGRVGRRGSRRAQQWLRLADGAARSPLESALRVRLVSAKVPPPVLDHAVVLTLVVVRPDMAWPEAKVCVELGAERTALLTAAGWIVVYAPPARVRAEFPAVLREVCRALARRQPELAARWTP
jgi:hypothetical protein